MSKVCIKCGIEKDEGEFYLKCGKPATICKACTKAAATKSYEQRKDLEKVTSVTGTKVCVACNTTKPYEDFHKRCGSPDGYSPRCKSCRVVETAAYNEKNREWINQKELARRSTPEGRAKHCERSRIYSKNNRQKRAEYCKQYNRRRRLSDPNFKMRKDIARRILLALDGNIKSASTEVLLGCTLKFFKGYIQSKFQEGMNWKNHGRYGWHYDHIIPCTAFNLEDPEQQKLCFHYTNYQPLWASDNLRKSNKIGPEWGNA
jgi:hypothetical protein